MMPVWPIMLARAMASRIRPAPTPSPCDRLIDGERPKQEGRGVAGLHVPQAHGADEAVVAVAGDQRQAVGAACGRGAGARMA